MKSQETLLNENKIVETVIKHLLDITSGTCSISEEMILNQKDDLMGQLLSGLLCTHETIAYQKEELKLLLQKEEKLAAAQAQADTQKIIAEELRAVNEKLKAGEQQLKGLNQQLMASEQQVKAANRQLNEEKNKLQVVMDAIEYGLTIQDKDYTIIYQNKILEGVFGGLGNKCYKVYEGSDKRCDGCPVEKSFIDGLSHTSDRKVTMPTGEVAYWENTANPIRNEIGEVVSCIEIARNITKTKQTDEAIRAINQQLMASEQQVKAANQQLKAKEQALLSKIADIELFNKLMVDRELDMIELKKEIDVLLVNAGQSAKYDMV